MALKHLEPELPIPAENRETPIAYADVSDVEALDTARKLNKGNNPTTSNVEFYLEIVAAELDGVLLEKGYQLPIPTTATGALMLMRGANAKGAWLQMEMASPTSENVDRATKMYEQSVKMLSTQAQVLETPKNTARSRPRGPGVTSPANPPQFEYGQEF